MHHHIYSLRFHGCVLGKVSNLSVLGEFRLCQGQQPLIKDCCTLRLRMSRLTDLLAGCMQWLLVYEQYIDLYKIKGDLRVIMRLQKWKWNQNVEVVEGWLWTGLFTRKNTVYIVLCSPLQSITWFIFMRQFK